MKNIILGSGIIGLLARHILGPSWKVVPYYRSRFFSFNPALDDNFIIADDEIDSYINQIKKVQKYPYKIGWSIQGAIIKQYDQGLCEDWLTKIFGSQVPGQSAPYMRSRMNFNVYDIRVNGLYEELIRQYINEIREEGAKGLPTEIGDHYIVRNGVKEDFDNCISTIPLPALLKASNLGTQLPSRTVHYLHFETKELDFEGCNQLLVTDSLFDFYKVTNVSPNRYLMYCHKDIPNPGAYLMGFLKNFDIIDGTSIEEAIPAGQIPQLNTIEKMGITCIGSNAQWDWCLDVGSCIKRIILWLNRGMKPQAPKIIDG